MRKSLFVVAVLYLLVCASPAYAQIQPVSYTVTVYVAGAQSPLGTPLTVQASQVPCDLPPAVGFSNINPDRWRWVDPARPGRECELPDAARLGALQDGNYEGTILATADNASAPTARVPFVRRRPQTPAVPTGLKIINSAL